MTRCWLRFQGANRLIRHITPLLWSPPVKVQCGRFLLGQNRCLARTAKRAGGQSIILIFNGLRGKASAIPVAVAIFLFFWAAPVVGRITGLATAAFIFYFWPPSASFRVPNTGAAPELLVRLSGFRQSSARVILQIAFALRLFLFALCVSVAHQPHRVWPRPCWSGHSTTASERALLCFRQ